MRRLITALMLVTAALIITAPAFGYDPGFSPFTRAELKRAKKLSPMKFIVDGKPTLLTGDKKDDYLGDRLDEKVNYTDGKGVIITAGRHYDDDGEGFEYRFSLTKDGKTLIDDYFIDEAMFHDSAYYGDLNADGVTDYVIAPNVGAQGIGGAICKLVVVLSSPSGYKVISGKTDFFVGPQNFIDMRGDGGCQYIATELAQALGHSYWEYELYEVTADGMKLANQLDKRFPILVQYTLKENHRIAEFSPRYKRLLLARSGHMPETANEFMPFTKANAPRGFPLTACMVNIDGNRQPLPTGDALAELLERHKGGLTFVDDKAGEVLVWIDDNSPYFSVMDKGKLVIDKAPLGSFAADMPSVYFGDMNRDGQTDYYIKPANDFGGAAILLSSTTGYRPYVFKPYLWGTENFIDTGDGTIRFLHASLRYIGETSYLVFDILEVKGDKVTVANESVKGFPNWELLYRPKGVKAVSLTDKLKADNHGTDSIFWNMEQNWWSWENER